jgi:hypothetical protein
VERFDGAVFRAAVAIGDGALAKDHFEDPGGHGSRAWAASGGGFHPDPVFQAGDFTSSVSIAVVVIVGSAALTCVPLP